MSKKLPELREPTTAESLGGAEMRGYIGEVFLGTPALNDYYSKKYVV